MNRVNPIPVPDKQGQRKSFLTFDDLDDTEFTDLLALCADLATGKQPIVNRLEGKSIGLLFFGPSTRTKTSFTAAILEAGASVVSLSRDEMQLSTGETIEDTGRILSMFLDGLVIRSNGPLPDMRAFAKGGLPVFNAMSDCEHPTQALADYAAIIRRFGSTEGLRIAYYGEGNNTVTAFAKMFSRLPAVDVDLYMPANYSVDPSILDRLAEQFRKSSGTLRVMHDVPQAPERADVIYCTRWRTMGQPHPDPNWLTEFAPFSMTQDLFERASKPDGVFMHDLPAVRGEDVVSSVLDGPRSIAWDQAYSKKIGAAASLLWSLNPLS